MLDDHSCPEGLPLLLLGPGNTPCAALSEAEGIGKGMHRCGERQAWKRPRKGSAALASRPVLTSSRQQPRTRSLRLCSRKCSTLTLSLHDRSREFRRRTALPADATAPRDARAADPQHTAREASWELPFANAFSISWDICLISRNGIP